MNLPLEKIETEFDIDPNYKEARIEPNFPIVPGEWEVTYQNLHGLTFGAKNRVVNHNVLNMTQLKHFNTEGYKIIRARRKLR